MVFKNIEQRRQEALKLLETLPEEFRWNNVKGPIMKRDEIVKEVKAGSEIGDSFVDLIDGSAPSDGPNALGKRYVCLNCWTELLNTKAGSSKEGVEGVVCCGQKMWIKQPRFMPSAD